MRGVVVADVSTPEGAAAVVDGAVSAFGGLDIVVSNVGGSGARTIDDMDAEPTSSPSSRRISFPRST